MPLIGNPRGSDGEKNSDHSLCRLLPIVHEGTTETRRPFSRMPVPTTGFSFPVPPAVEETYAADKVFHHGRLLPFNVSPPTASENRVETGKLGQTMFLNLRRSESLDGNTRHTRSDALNADYQLLRRASSDPRPMPATGTSSKWPLFLLGTVRLPAEMEMRDIRNRQRRRCQAPSAVPTVPATASDHGRHRSRWGILRALSCKAAENTAMTPVVRAPS